MQKNTKEKNWQGRLERAAQERELRKAKFQCVVLGAAVIGLVGALAWQTLHKDHQETANMEGGQVRVAGPDSDYRQGLQEDGTVSGRDDTSSWTGTDLLVLVNKKHEIPADYQVDLHWLNNGSCAVAEEMYGALKEMLTDGSTEGREFVVASGYRSKEQQRELLDEDIFTAIQYQGLSWQEAYEQETLETMPPGCSEHETGLAVDIVSLNYQILDEQQEYTEENRWLRDNCSKYGFILRYPKEAGEITGVSYEPWHFRYVGEAAEEIMSRGITLEEYLGESGCNF